LAAASRCKFNSVERIKTESKKEQTRHKRPRRQSALSPRVCVALHILFILGLSIWAPPSPAPGTGPGLRRVNGHIFVSPLFGNAIIPPVRQQTKPTHPSLGDQWRWVGFVPANGGRLARGFRHGYDNHGRKQCPGGGRSGGSGVRTTTAEGKGKPCRTRQRELTTKGGGIRLGRGRKIEKIRAYRDDRENL
jgi:hypothetical protein